MKETTSRPNREKKRQLRNLMTIHGIFMIINNITDHMNEINNIIKAFFIVTIS